MPGSLAGDARYDVAVDGVVMMRLDFAEPGVSASERAGRIESMHAAA